jgi:antitoxin (DNA-binding transcriptional repressor) of toxin-antitoxin stability system
MKAKAKSLIIACREMDLRKPRGKQKNTLHLLRCDAIMYHMKQASVRDLRYRFSEVEDLLRDGQEIQITKRRRVIAKLVPAPARDGRRPNFLARLRKIYGSKLQKKSGADLLAEERGKD